MASTIEIQHQEVTAALQALQDRIGNMTPVLLAIGEDMTERIKRRFETASSPAGAKWTPNAPSTIVNYLQKRGGFSAKTGKITAKGQRLATSKRPLQGDSGDLARQIVPDVVGNELTVGSTQIYAAMQHFGGKKSQFPKLWGDIPARPFLPVTATGDLYPSEAEAIIDMISEYLAS